MNASSSGKAVIVGDGDHHEDTSGTAREQHHLALGTVLSTAFPIVRACRGRRRRIDGDVVLHRR